MRRTIGLGICILVICLTAASAEDDTKHFDGTWDTTVSCSNTEGALGYSYQFPSTVKDGVLHGEKGDKGKPGRFELDGKILPDGTMKLYAKGLVGAEEVAVGHRPRGSAFGYHVEGKFSEKEGTGKRVEGRPCAVDFAKK
jgi:hypothetical protein